MNLNKNSGGGVMDKKTRLINIYLKINQKRDLSWDDLEYLALYDPECFEKTCKNVVYNIPQTKEIILQEKKKEEKQLPAIKEDSQRMENRFSIKQALNNLKKIEGTQVPFVDFDVERVKNLLGNLYMELLFPHNELDSFFYIPEDERGSKFDKKA